MLSFDYVCEVEWEGGRGVGWGKSITDAFSVVIQNNEHVPFNSCSVREN